MNAATHIENNRGRSLALTAATHAMNHAMYNMMTPLALTLSAYFHFKEVSKVTIGFTLYLAFYGFSQVPVGFISDHVPRKTVLAAGTILNGIAVAMAAIFPTYGMFRISLALAGIGSAAYHPVGATYLSDLYNEAKGKALGISGIGATVGLFLGPVLGGALCHLAGWRVTFLVFAAASIALGIVYYILAVEPQRAVVVKGQRKGNWTNAIILFLAAAAVIFTFREFAGWGGYYLMPIFVEKIYKYPIAAAGFIGGLQSLGGFFAQPLGGWLSDKFGRRWLMIGLLAAAALFMFLIPHVGPALIVPMVFLYGVAYTATVPIIDALIADRTPSSIRGGVFGIFMATGIGISSFSQLALGKILDKSAFSFHGFQMSFGLLAASILVSMTCMLLFRNAESHGKQ